MSGFGPSRISSSASLTASVGEESKRLFLVLWNVAGGCHGSVMSGHTREKKTRAAFVLSVFHDLLTYLSRSAPFLESRVHQVELAQETEQMWLD